MNKSRWALRGFLRLLAGKDKITTHADQARPKVFENLFFLTLLWPVVKRLMVISTHCKQEGIDIWYPKGCDTNIYSDVERSNYVELILIRYETEKDLKFIRASPQMRTSSFKFLSISENFIASSEPSNKSSPTQWKRIRKKSGTLSNHTA